MEAALQRLPRRSKKKPPPPLPSMSPFNWGGGRLGMSRLNNQPIATPGGLIHARRTRPKLKKMKPIAKKSINAHPCAPSLVEDNNQTLSQKRIAPLRSDAGEEGTGGQGEGGDLKYANRENNVDTIRMSDSRGKTGPLPLPRGWGGVEGGGGADRLVAGLVVVGAGVHDEGLDGVEDVPDGV